MNTNTEVNSAKAYCAGKFAAYMESISMTAPLTENRLDEIKENLSHYCEKKIDDSQLSDQDKKEQKRQMKQSLEVYIQGSKDEIRAKGNGTKRAAMESWETGQEENDGTDIKLLHS